MLPVDLEHMLVSEAAELTLRANRIARLDPEEPSLQPLRTTASELTAARPRLAHPTIVGQPQTHRRHAR